LRFLGYGRNGVDGGECTRPLFLIGHVIIQQRQIKLHMQRFFVQLPRQVHARSGALMCLYKLNTTLLATMESPVAKNATKRSIRCRSAAFMRRCKLTQIDLKVDRIHLTAPDAIPQQFYDMYRSAIRTWSVEESTFKSIWSLAAPHECGGPASDRALGGIFRNRRFHRRPTMWC